eukprot:scaffold51492_cov26-Cyclotella_meneghiniana.AAC.1
MVSSSGHDHIYVMGWLECITAIYESTLTLSKVVTASGPESSELYPCPPRRTERSLNQTRPQGMHQNNIQVLDCP